MWMWEELTEWRPPEDWRKSHLEEVLKTITSGHIFLLGIRASSLLPPSKLHTSLFHWQTVISKYIGRGSGNVVLRLGKAWWWWWCEVCSRQCGKPGIQSPRMQASSDEEKSTNCFHLHPLLLTFLLILHLLLRILILDQFYYLHPPTVYIQKKSLNSRFIPTYFFHAW